MAVDALSVADIERLCDSRILARGRDYFLSGAVVDRVRFAGGIGATVLGARSYRVDVRSGLHFRCSCPFDLNGACKHVVATLLAWRERPETFVEEDPVTRAIGRLTKRELAAILRELSDRYPEIVAKYRLR